MIRVCIRTYVRTYVCTYVRVCRYSNMNEHTNCLHWYTTLTHVIPSLPFYHLQTYTRMLACHSHMLHVRTYTCIFLFPSPLTSLHPCSISTPLPPSHPHPTPSLPSSPHSLPHILTPLPPSYPHPTPSLTSSSLSPLTSLRPRSTLTPLPSLPPPLLYDLPPPFRPALSPLRWTTINRRT